MATGQAGATPRTAGARPDGVVLECRGLHKHFSGVVAVGSVDLEVRAGEFLAVVGDNGAGKSTLIKMLCGALQPDSGDIFLMGEKTVFDGPLDARLRGIEVVHQDLALISTMDVPQNLYLGRELVRTVLGIPILRRRAMTNQASEHLAKLGLNFPVVRGQQVDRLSGGMRQGVAIARALTWQSGVLILDEPTAALGVKQSELVLSLARRVVERGSAVVLISHTLPYVMQFADRIAVMRHGEKVADLPRSVTTPELLVSHIVGVESQDTLSRIVSSQWSSAENAKDEERR